MKRQRGYFPVMVRINRVLAVWAALALLPTSAIGQGQTQQPQAPQQPSAPQPQQQQQAVVWERLPRMQIEETYAGPLKDTTIQRWRDGEAVCYLYVPFTAQHSQPTATGYVLYGPNNIGAISCFYAPPAAVAAARKPTPAPKPRVEQGQH
jgi:hypothetical protein